MAGELLRQLAAARPQVRPDQAHHLADAGRQRRRERSFVDLRAPQGGQRSPGPRGKLGLGALRGRRQHRHQVRDRRRRARPLAQHEQRPQGAQRLEVQLAPLDVVAQQARGVIEQRAAAVRVARSIEQLRQRGHRRHVARITVDGAAQLDARAAQIAGAHEQLSQANAIGGPLLHVGLDGDQPIGHGQRLLRITVGQVQIGQRLQSLAVVGLDAVHAFERRDGAPRIGHALAIDVTEAEEAFAQSGRIALHAGPPQVHLAGVAPRLLVPQQLGQTRQPASMLGLLLQDRVQLGARARPIAQPARQQLGARQPQRRHLERIRRHGDARRQRVGQRRRVVDLDEQRAQLLERGLVRRVDLQHRTQQAERPAPIFAGDPGGVPGPPRDGLRRAKPACARRDRRRPALLFVGRVLGERGRQHQRVHTVLGHAQAGGLRFGGVDGQRERAATGRIPAQRPRRRQAGRIDRQRRAPAVRGPLAIRPVLRQLRQPRLHRRDRHLRLLL